jgi:acetate kinase
LDVDRLKGEDGLSILAFNAGSSTLKHALFDDAASREIASGAIDVSPEAGGHRAAAARTFSSLQETGASAGIRAVGHRVVHGGDLFRGSVRIDETVSEGLARLSELAPLHNPPALAVIEAAREALPAAPQVAVFDTAFYADLPARARVYPLPWEWHAEWGVRRFGFHGISHSYCAGRAAELLGSVPRRLVTCHLGNGCSATAVCDGAAAATTMGFTPMEGLMMGSRSGSVDPGILFWIERHRGLTARELDDILNHRSGLLGVSGISSDFREVEAAAREGNERARLAIEIYSDRVRGAIGSLAATLGGLDALVFTAGVGEHSATLRAAVCEGLEFLGLRLDPKANSACRPDADVAASDAKARILVIQTREELVIARETRSVAFAEVA